MPPSLPSRASVVVVGGGAIGAATTFSLARKGVTEVLLLERETLASGSTGRATGGIRLQFSDELNVRMMLRSVDVFERWEEVVGADLDYLPDIGFRQNGYLIAVDRPGDLPAFEAANRMQRALGVPSELLDPAEAARHVPPQIRLDDALACAWCPRDGYATPDAAVTGFAAAAARRGATVVQRCPVTGIDVVDGEVRAVETPLGRVETGIVVSAAGPWSPALGALAGVEIPIEPERHVNWWSPDAGGLPDDLPLVIDFTTGFHVRREGPGVLFGSHAKDLEAFAGEAVKRFPGIVELPIAREIAGDYDTSPDGNAIICEAPSPSRFLLATGFSGHGFMQAPAIGEHLAELVLGEEPTLDFGALRLERFASGETRPETIKL